jgi:F-type H+-transporting ATPase subunit h
MFLIIHVHPRSSYLLL